MKKILIATHGYLADGFKSSISLLTGGEDAIETICAYVDESDYTARIQTFVDSLSPEDDGVIFTDIYGGSVCQKVALIAPGHPQRVPCFWLQSGDHHRGAVCPRTHNKGKSASDHRDRPVNDAAC